MKTKRTYIRKKPLPSHMLPIPAEEQSKNPGWSIEPGIRKVIQEETARRNAPLEKHAPHWTVSAVATEMIVIGLRASGLME